MTTLTSNYGWSMPDPGGSPNTWGDTLNQTTGKIDAAVKLNELSGMPVGAGAMWFTPTPPANWILLQGQTLTRSAPYDKLFGLFGTTFNVGTVAADSFMLPDLRQKFPLGANVFYPLGLYGGTFSYTLAAANLPAHTHPASQAAHSHVATNAAHAHTVGNTAAHSHVIATGNHSHTIVTGNHSHTVQTVIASGSGATNGGAVWSFGTATTTTQGDLGGYTSTQGNLGGGTDTNPGLAVGNTDARTPVITVDTQTPTVTVSANTGGGQAISIVPAFLAINFMIKYA